eukprot:6735419-Pyramimonas_sp.AAC.3
MQTNRTGRARQTSEDTSQSLGHHRLGVRTSTIPNARVSSPRRLAKELNLSPESGISLTRIDTMREMIKRRVSLNITLTPQGRGLFLLHGRIPEGALITLYPGLSPGCRTITNINPKLNYQDFKSHHVEITALASPGVQCGGAVRVSPRGWAGRRLHAHHAALRGEQPVPPSSAWPPDAGTEWLHDRRPPLRPVRGALPPHGEVTRAALFPILLHFTDPPVPITARMHSTSSTPENSK